MSKAVKEVEVASGQWALELTIDIQKIPHTLQQRGGNHHPWLPPCYTHGMTCFWIVGERWKLRATGSTILELNKPMVYKGEVDSKDQFKSCIAD